MGDPVAIGAWLKAANEAKDLADPKIQMADSALARQSMMSGGVGRQESPYLTAMQQVGSGENTPRFSFVPFQDWFSPPPKRW